MTIETHEVLVLKKRQKLRRHWCECCDCEVEMVAADYAAVMAGMSLRSLCREVESGRLHYAETTDGALLICLNSLINQS